MSDLWTISRLADETLMDRRTIKRILHDVKPVSEDGKSEFYRLPDFVQALIRYYGHQEEAVDLVKEQAKWTKVKREIAEVERARVRRESLTVDAAFRYFDSIISPIRRIIELSALTRAEQDKIWELIQSIDRKAMIDAIASEHKDGPAEAGPTDIQPPGEAGMAEE